MAQNGTPYRKEALYVTESTTVDEIVEYLRYCIENPVVVEDNVVWNFSTHEVDMDALDVRDKEQDRFAIPYQVTGTWGFLYQLLPEAVKEAEVLVYQVDEGEYHAYRNFYRTTQAERQDQIRQDLSRRLEVECPADLGIHE